jgi:hypothetical protein
MRIGIIIQPNNRVLRTDGKEFEARAKDAMSYYGGSEFDVLHLPKGNWKTKEAVTLKWLESLPPRSLDRLLVFAHGYSSKFSEAFGTVARFRGKMSAAVDRVMSDDDPRIGLYCCLLGDTLDGFAAAMHTETGCTVLANKSSSPWGTVGGHTTRNPHKRIFWNDGTVIDLMPPYGSRNRNAWISELKTNPDLPFQVLEGMR